MPRVSIAFFAVGALCALAGMLWGSSMGISGDHTMAPAHAHLNLVGWCTLSIMGAFYGLAGDAAPRRLAWINLVLSAAGAVLMAGMLVLLFSGKLKGPEMMNAEIPTVLGMLCFIVAIFRTASARRA